MVFDNGAVLTRRLPTYFISHGGGPCFDMTWPNGNPFERLRDYLDGFAAAVGVRPRAILVISAHWETDVPRVTAAANPPLIYDYTGFPAHTYALRYDAPGSLELATRVTELLRDAGIASATDARRGFDHGLFVPMRRMYPAADIPVVQLSILADYDPQRHLALGAALAPLRDENILIVGSGMSFHNLRTMFDGEAREAAAFDGWLADVVTGSPSERGRALERWAAAPSARAAHPAEDHLMPLLVASGAAAGDPGEVVYRDVVLGKAISGYRFGSGVTL